MAFSSATDGPSPVRIVSTSRPTRIYQMWRFTLASMTFVWIMKRFTPKCMTSRNSYVIPTTLTAGGRRHLTLHSSSSSGECRSIVLLVRRVFPSDSTRGYMKLSRLSREYTQTQLFTLNCFSAHSTKSSSPLRALATQHSTVRCQMCWKKFNCKFYPPKNASTRRRTHKKCAHIRPARTPVSAIGIVLRNFSFFRGGRQMKAIFHFPKFFHFFFCSARNFITFTSLKTSYFALVSQRRSVVFQSITSDCRRTGKLWRIVRHLNSICQHTSGLVPVMDRSDNRRREILQKKVCLMERNWNGNKKIARARLWEWQCDLFSKKLKKVSFDCCSPFHKE